MFARCARLAVRSRCMHTLPSRSGPSHHYSRHLRLALGTSAVAAAYLTWRWASNDQRIALDAQETITTSKHGKNPPSNSNSLSESQDNSDPSPGNKPESSSQTDDSSSPSTSEDKEEPPAPPEPTSDPDTEEETSTGAFDPITGEINWDCPCLGGMAHGPCGPQFREAFSCFVYSDQEQKGIDCVEKFKAMQDCFREHPDVYAEEIMADDEDEELSVQEDGNGEGGVVEQPPAGDEVRETEKDPAAG